RTVFVPESDPGAPPASGSRLVYQIDAVAVDRNGRFSPVASTDLTLIPASPGDRAFFVDEAGVISFGSPDVDLGPVLGDTITGNGYTTSGGGHALGITPWSLMGLTGGTTVTFVNRDTASHHLRSVYTPLDRADPFLTP